jgi:N-acetyl-gamma-glutamyl-phosphate reductase
MLLLRILANHPEIDTVVSSSRSQAGMPTLEADTSLPMEMVRRGIVAPTVLSPDDALQQPGDVVFSALPHGASAEVCEPLLGSVPVIDLSADFRFADEERFRGAYGSPRPAPVFQDAAVYGLVEWNREAIHGAKIIANPGCYPTATLLPLLPLIREGVVTGRVIITAMSGITGAGRTAKVNTLFGERTENVNAYNPGTLHRHRAEIAEQIGLAGDDGISDTVLFTPHLVPLKQGMAVTTVVPMDEPRRGVELLRDRYASERFVELTGERPPETREVRGTNRIRIGWRIESEAFIVMSVIDNLWKGASGQAVQNMNVLFGFDEELGLLRTGDL